MLVLYEGKIWEARKLSDGKVQLKHPLPVYLISKEMEKTFQNSLMRRDKESISETKTGRPTED